MLVDKKKLKQYIENNFNVLFEGERGVGKTATIFNTFKEANLRLKYFSAPTMDPWTDLVGVPSTVVRPDGKEVVRIIPPEDFADDNYDVIFIDELNRAPPKVLNALMELIQFGTINGKSYKIKMIWAAINPHNEDGDYDVNKLDLALKDRFQIQIKIPYKLDEAFFKSTLGSVGEVFADWWKSQPDEVQKEISPRRLHQSAQFHINGGDFTDMIDQGNTAKLKETLKARTQVAILEKDFDNKEIKSSLSILNKNYSTTVREYLIKNKTTFNFFFPHLNEEWLSSEFSKTPDVKNYLLNIAKGNDSPSQLKAHSLITSIVSGNINSSFVRGNITLLQDYLPKEYIQKIEEEKAALPNYCTQNQSESKILKTLFSSNPMDNSYKQGATELAQSLTTSQMFSLISTIQKDAAKEIINVNRIKQLIAFKIAGAFALYLSENVSHASAFTKVFEHVTNSSTKKYLWKDKVISEEFKDMGEIILEKMKLFEGLTTADLKDKYLSETSLNYKKKKNKAMK